MKEKPYSFPPFRSPLEEAEIEDVKTDEIRRNHIFQLQNDPETIVRKSYAQSSFLELSEGREKVVRLAKKEFDLLRDTYDLPVKAEFVIVGENSVNAEIYSITDRVHEKSDDIVAEKNAQKEVLLGLLAYYHDKLRSFNSETKQTDYFLDDISVMEQYVYGTTRSESKPQLHLVDIEHEHLANDLKGLETSMLDMCADDIGILYDHVKWAQQEGKSLEDIRKPLLAFLDEFEDTKKYFTGSSSKSPNYFLRDRLEQVFSD